MDGCREQGLGILEILFDEVRVSKVVDVASVGRMDGWMD